MKVEKFQLSGSAQISHARSEWKPTLNSNRLIIKKLSNVAQKGNLILPFEENLEKS